MPEPSPRTQLEVELRRAYSKDRLPAVVQSVLGERLVDVVNLNASYESVMFDFMNYLEQDDERLQKFLATLSMSSSSPPSLRRTIDDYVGVPVLDDDPFSELVPNGRPFVDRKDFRNRLREFFDSIVTPLFYVRGPRQHGRSFSKELLHHIGRAEGINIVPIDLVGTDALMVYQLITYELGIPPLQMRDREAQAPALARGLVAGLRNRSRSLEPGERWCIVFDQYDVDEVAPPLRQFVDTLAFHLLPPTTPGIFVVVLGHDRPPPVSAGFHSVEDDISPIYRADVARFVREWSERVGRDFSDAAVERVCDNVLDGLSSPLTPACLPRMQERLYSFVHSDR